MDELISGRFKRWVREHGPEPLVTYYDVTSGERTELSGTSLANWVAKTGNLLVDELTVDPGDLVELDVARTHPGHWVSLVWELACWELGATVTIGRPAEARLVVTGPELTATGSAEVVACSLHPLGLGFATPLPAGVIDYSLEVRGQGDRFAARPPAGLAPAWRDGERQLTQAELVQEATADPTRRLLRPESAWSAARALVDALSGGGSLVVVAGPVDPDRLAALADQEQAVTA